MNTTKPRASFGEALRRAHGVLEQDLSRLDEAASSTSEEWLAEVRIWLGATHARITEHFRFEEQGGYMREVRKREPRLERVIQELGAEHADLRASLEVLIREAGAAAAVDNALRERIRAWIAQVKAHEARENEVVQNAFNYDISAED
jgi:hypothetical protein